jgi:hypothetical protein
MCMFFNTVWTQKELESLYSKDKILGHLFHGNELFAGYFFWDVRKDTRNSTSISVCTLCIPMPYVIVKTKGNQEASPYSTAYQEHRRKVDCMLYSHVKFTSQKSTLKVEN